MSKTIDLKKRTEFFLKDLHAREYMRLGWYRQMGIDENKVRVLRERKSYHTAFLKDLLRKRGISPAWYARYFYLVGHLFGFFSALLPQKFMQKTERTLEFWILMRYQKYLKQMNIDSMLRSMIESVELQKMGHNEPAPDAIQLLETCIKEQERMMAVSWRR